MSSRPHASTRYGKTCDTCGTAITVGRGDPAICGDCRVREAITHAPQHR